jgi:FtsH-binding integral membrane protein
MPEYEWTCVACKETNPPYTEACRNCYALAEPTISCVRSSSVAQSVVAVKPLEPPVILPASGTPPIVTSALGTKEDVLLKSDVFDRSIADGAVITNSTYNLVIGLVLCWGFLVNWLLVHYVNPSWLIGLHPLVFIIGYFASCFYGVYLFNSSKEPAISFIGYNFVVVPFGLVVNIIVSRHDPDLVLQAIQLTATATILMMVVGSVVPELFQKIHTTLTIALLCVLVVELFQIFVLKMHSDWIDWVVAVIFCGYIGYDWGRANRIPKTVDNAVDSAAAIYMDIINLFVRILRILGKKR